jgi:ADP-heptose:LPS heptosyltransferase
LGFSKVFYLVGSKRPDHLVRRDSLFFRICGIKQRIGFHAIPLREREPRDPGGLPGRVRYEGTARLERLRKDGACVTNSTFTVKDPTLVREPDLTTTREWLSAHRREPLSMLLAVCPATNMPAKEWRIDNFSEIGKRLLSAGNYEIVVLGGGADRAKAASLVHGWGAGINACGELTVTQSACLLSMCSLCLTLDSGPMHLAAAVGTPCVALFSGRDFPGRWDPPGPNHHVIRHAVPCGGCMAENCPLPGHPCMTGITIHQVWESIKAALDLEA